MRYYECDDNIEVDEIEVGVPVYFMGINGRNAELEKASKLFAIGQKLIISDYGIDDWNSYLYFENVEGAFNSVMFSRNMQPVYEDVSLEILIEDLTDEEADQMKIAVEEIARKYGVEIEQLEMIKKD